MYSTHDFHSFKHGQPVDEYSYICEVQSFVGPPDGPDDMEDMIGVEDIPKRMEDIRCAVCKKSRFFILPTPISSFAENLYTARCLDCAYTFPVGIPTKPISQTQPDTAQWLMGLPCPQCGEIGVNFDFRCTASVRDTFYFVTCKDCKHTFHEKASMEAYE